MQFDYPHTIENGGGEKITFLKLIKDPAGDRLEVENFVSPNGGPPMHVHFKQDEGLTVVKGRIGAQVMGEEPKYFGPGESIDFKAGIAHRFWNAGEEPLICKGYIQPANNAEYFLTELYKSTAANGGERPGTFDSAWLLRRYRSEFDMLAVPGFRKKGIFPGSPFFRRLAGKHKKFEGAPEP
ncbi:MAG TPA: cupin domain-containing protein, partial [Flavilitoribacter sp.]|nr:cupin domain-containing protein [Flavilitoribacter sp.]